MIAKGIPMRRLSALTILGAALFLTVQPLAAQTLPSCALIDKTISATEDFAEFALAGETGHAREALGVLHQTFTKIKSGLSADAVAKAQTQIDAADTAFAARDLPRAAVAAVETYRVLIVALRSRLPTTLDVAMLDYTGFKFHALNAVVPKNWNAIAENVSRSAENTAKAQKRLTGNTGLADLIGNIQTGLAGASAAKIPGWLDSAAQIQLDSVDLLEQVIKNPSPDACT